LNVTAEEIESLPDVFDTGKLLYIFLAMSQLSHHTSSSSSDSIVVVDVGASGGLHHRWRSVCPRPFGILFEPDPRAFEELRQGETSGLIINTALSDRKGEIDFHVCKAQPLSSVYKPNIELMEKYFSPKYLEGFEVSKTLRIQSDTLDNQLRLHNIADVDFVKLDVQGHELAILKGAKDMLKSIVGLEVEVGFIEVYQKQPLFFEVHEFVSHLGFQLIDFEKSYSLRKGTANYGIRKGQAIFGIALYFQSPEDLVAREGLTEAKLLRAAKTYLAYGYCDIAETCCKLAMQKRIISTAGEEEIRSLLDRFKVRFHIPQFKGKQRLHRILARVTRSLGGTPVNDVDMGIGNFHERKKM